MENFSINKRLISVIIAVAMIMVFVPMNVFAAELEEPEELVAAEEIVEISAEELPDSVSSTSSYAGGWGISWTTRQLYDDGDLHNYIIGAVLPAGVGFTIIDETDDAYLIDTYSTPYTHLAGVWVAKGGYTLNFSYAMAGEVNNTVNVFGGTNTNGFYQIGTLYSGDIVTILAKSSSWYFIEFNDSYYLRKRGWVPSAYITKYGSSTVQNMSYIIGSTTQISGSDMTVYYAPGNGYVGFTVMPAGKQFTVVDFEYIHGDEFMLVNYFSGSKVVTGYIAV